MPSFIIDGNDLLSIPPAVALAGVRLALFIAFIAVL